MHKSLGTKVDNVCDIDIKENYIYHLNKSILEILLKDHTTNKNIIWATDTYAWRVKGYQPQDPIAIKSITGIFGSVIKPRIKKSQKEQKQRIKAKAEVFTPSWICKKMADSLDVMWNRNESNHWQDYVKLRVLEITCGEAPFLASRYDTVSGEWLYVQNRIGLLDRKLQAISENINSEQDWVQWAFEAYKSTYGYEWQGDSLLIARENLLFTFIDYYIAKFENYPINEYLIEVSKIISWNIWQMDGLKGSPPNYNGTNQHVQLSFFDDELIVDDNDVATQNYCIIKNWLTKRTINFRNNNGDYNMKFDFVIGNPPYQETKSKSKTQTQPNSSWVYHNYQFEADRIAKCSCLIYPFGGWFDSRTSLNGLGNTILKDGRTVFVHAYEGTSDKRAWYRNDKLPSPIFSNIANLSAGVSIVLRTASKRDSFEFSNRIYTDDIITVKVAEADELTPNPLFVNINKKLFGKKLCDNIKKGIFGIESNFVELNQDKVSLNEKDWKDPIVLVTNDKSGSSGRTKTFYTSRDNILKGQDYFSHYKIIMASAYPKKSIISGEPTLDNVKARLEELIEILQPNSAFGRSRMALFMSTDKTECDYFIKYTQTTFFAGLTLQEPNRSSSFGSLIPMQDFSMQSDIDWSKTIEEIDLQLYKKYKLTDEEIGFIENRVGENN